MSDVSQTEQSQWMVLNRLNFWLWACRRDAVSFLEASKKLQLILGGIAEAKDIVAFNNARLG
ncbi:MAG: hypothetical protein JZU55_15920, partial [Afipia sp.]|nr:hypothetical protein [Afipia sp.]